MQEHWPRWSIFFRTSHFCWRVKNSPEVFRHIRDRVAMSRLVQQSRFSGHRYWTVPLSSPDSDLTVSRRHAIVERFCCRWTGRWFLRVVPSIGLSSRCLGLCCVSSSGGLDLCFFFVRGGRAPLHTRELKRKLQNVTSFTAEACKNVSVMQTVRLALTTIKPYKPPHSRKRTMPQHRVITIVVHKNHNKLRGQWSPKFSIHGKIPNFCCCKKKVC